MYGRYGKDSGNWKGDNASYISIQRWVCKKIPRPKLCEICGNVPPTIVKNIAGVCNRDFINYKCICRSCEKPINNTVRRLEN